MSNDAAKPNAHQEDVPQAKDADRHPPPLPFDPVGKTRYTAEEIHALFEGAPPPGEDNNRTVLAAHPDRPATKTG